MAGNLGALVVSLGLDGAEFFAGLARSDYLARQTMRSIQRSVEDARTTINRFVGGLAAISGGAISAAGFITAFEAIKREAIESEQSILQMNAALKATGGAAGLTVRDLDELGASIKASTNFSTEDIRKAETALLRFRDIRRDVFDEAIRRAPDLAAALGIDLTGAAQKLGRALEDPAKGLRALREAGVFLDETQILLAAHFSELGDKAAAQKIVMDAVAASTSGAAKAATEGLLGVTERLARSFKDLQTVSGKKLFGDNHAEVEGFIGYLDRLVEHVERTNVSITKLITEPGALARTALAEGGAALQGYRGAPPSPRFASGKIGGLSGFELSAEQDAARQAALDADIARRIAAKTAEQFNALKSFAEKSAQYYASDAALQKYFLSIQTSQLEFSYAQGTTATAEYYGALESLARQSFNAQDKILAQRAKAEEAILGSQYNNETDRSAARARLAGIVGQSDQLRLGMHERLNLLSQQEIAAIQRLKDEYTELGAAAAEAAGDLAGAAVARFESANRIKRRTLERDASSLDPVQAALAQTGLYALDAQTERIRNQNLLTAATLKYGLVVGAVGIEQSRIDLLLQTGAITEIDAINKRAALATDYVSTLRDQADEQERIARKLQGPEQDAALLGVKKFRLEIDQLAASADVLAKKFNDIFVSGTANFLTDLIDHTKTWKQAWTDAAKSVEQSISKIATQNIGEKLFGKEGPLGGVGGFFAGLFGGKAGDAGAQSGVAALGSTASIAAASASALAASMAAAASAATLFSISASAGGLPGVFIGSNAGGLGGLLGPGGIFSGLFLAGGGDPPVGKWSVVGENGPELFMPKTAGTIIPLDEYRNGKRGNIVNMGGIHINVPQGTSRASADQIGLAAARHVQRAAGKLG